MATKRNKITNSSRGETESNGHLANGEVTTRESQKDQKDVSRADTASAAAMVLSPALLTTFLLIFGGCCSNVYTLESILSLSPATGSLITFLQFLCTSLFSLPSQLTTKQRSVKGKPANSSSFLPRLRVRSVPLYKWLVYTAMFLLVNILNNNAFNYKISIPLHIILRSAGPVTSMLVGYFFAGRRYALRQVLAVMLLFSGVVMAALSDASSKGKMTTSDAATSSELSKQLPGFALLFSALLISAFMGIYTDNVYKQHGRSATVANENLFYSHLLSLPWFATQYKSLYGQYVVMAANSSTQVFGNTASLPDRLSLPSILRPVASHLPSSYLFKHSVSPVPILLLLANAFTQIICITGVHRLSAQTTSLTVTIVLNIRKLVSLVLSIWLFGNSLPPGVTVGAIVVFLGVGLYGWPSRSAKKKDSKSEQQTGKQSKKEI